MRKQPLVLIAIAASVSFAVLGGFLLVRSQHAPDRVSTLEVLAREKRAKGTELTELGEHYFQRGDLLKAAEMALRARRDEPDIPSPYNLLGAVYVKLADQSTAAQQTKNAVELYEKARQSFEKGVALAPSSTAMRLNLARVLLAQHHTKPAVAQLEEVLRLDRGSAEAWTLAGKAQRQAENHVGAFQSYSKAMELDPRLTEPKVALAIMHIDFDRPREAVPLLEQAYSLGDHSPETASYLALALLTAAATDADAARAKTVLHEAREPENPPAVFSRGLLALRGRDYPKALECFRQILKIDPRNQRAQFALAQTYQGMGNQQAADATMKRFNEIVTQRQRIDSLAQRLQKEGPHADLLAEYGKALLAAGRLDEAESRFRQWAAASPKDPEPKMWLERVRAQKRSRAGTS